MGGIIGTARGGEVAIAAQREADKKHAADGRPMSRAIDNELLRSAKEEDTYHKLLLLGAGESGKSTFFKQVQQLYGRGFHSEADRRPYLPPIHSNVIDSIKKLVEQARLMAQHAAAAAQHAAQANAAAAAAAAHAHAQAVANGTAEPATPVSNVNHTPTPQPLNPHAHAAAIAAAAALPGAVGTGAAGDGKADRPEPVAFGGASDAPASTASGSGSGSVSVSASASVADGAAAGAGAGAAGAGAGAMSVAAGVPQLKPMSDGRGSSTPQRTSPKTNAASAVAHVVADVPLPTGAQRKASGGDGAAAAAAAAAGTGAGAVPNGIAPSSPIAHAMVAAAAAAAATPADGRPPLPRARTKGSAGAAAAAAAAAVIVSGSVNAVPIARANGVSAEFVMTLPSQAMVTPEVARHVKLLWADPAIKNAFEMRAAFQLPDTCAYLFERIDAIGAPDYVPSYEDVLHVRARTTGIAETTFGMEGGAKFRLMDVGGQRNERKKWINMFDKVTAVIFVVAMSEYDQMMFEDAVTNRMQDALQLFADTCNLRWFEDTSIILFLNKNDIFQQKIKKVDLKVCFPDYTGGCNYDRAYQWIRKKFLSCNLTPDKKKIYSHITCATNTSNVNFTFHVVKDIVIKRNLKDFGLIT